MKLRIGHLSTFYHTAMILMAKGIAGSRLGVDVEWRLFGTGPAIVNAFEKGELDLAYIGLPPALIGIDRGVPIICIAGGHMEGTVISGRKGLRGFPEEEELGSILAQLKGKKIGIPGKGSIHDVIMRKLIESFHLEDEIEVVNFQWSDLITEAMARGDVDAAAGTPALAIAVKRFADGRVLYPPARLWPNNPSYGIVVRKDLLVEARQSAERFLILHEEAEAFLREDPAGVSELISGYLGFIDAEFILDTLKVSPRYCSQLTEAYIHSTMEFVRVLKALRYINREIGRNEIFDTSLIRQVHPEKDHYMGGIS